VTLLKIHVFGSPILRQETVPVPKVTDDLRRLVDDMFETMHAAKGIGLAAPQVGRPERLTVVEIEGAPLVLFNPEIVSREGDINWEEGCLSIPDVFAHVDRSAKVRVRAMDRAGDLFEVEGSELLAVCLQHEIDHLHGKLFIDHLSYFKRRSAMAAWEKIRGQYPNFLRTLTPEDVAAHHKDDAL
jgi:peptide deformylase